MHLELLVELVQQCGQDLESFLHDRESAVLIVSMVDTAVAIATHLYVKLCLLEVSNQWEAASDGVWLALTHHLLRSLLKFLEGI